MSTPHSFLATPKMTIETLQAFGLHTKKRLGQHFLIDDNVIGRILDAANVGESDQILEIGPGIGVLTVALLKQLGEKGRLLALEYDAQLIEVLQHTTEDSPKLVILNEDALKIPQLSLPLQPTKLIANLPYQVAATNVLDCFEYLPSLLQATVMVQREVAERMAARPGTKAYGAYSAKLQLLARPVGSFAVSRNSFLPPPRVDSSVITLLRHSAEDSLVTDIDHYRAVAALIDACFAQRRKTIYNNLRAVEPNRGVTQHTPQMAECEARGCNDEDLQSIPLLGSADVIKGALDKAQISPTARAETLHPADFVRLQQEISQLP